MRIDWTEPPVSRRNQYSLWTKVKNNISVLRQTHDGPPPRQSSSSRSHSQSRSHSSSSRPPVHRSNSTGSPRPPFQERRSSSRPPTSRGAFVTIATNGGAPQAVHSSGQYGSAYIVTSPVPSPIVYQNFPSSSATSSPTSSIPSYYPSSHSTSRPGGATRRSTAPMGPSPLRTPSSTPSRSPPSTPRGRPTAPTRSSTAPLARSSNGTEGLMYNGKLIVGDPDEVQKYISSQKRIENWCKEVR